MKLLTVVWVGLCLTISVVAQNHTMETPKPVTAMTGLGDLHHPVSTKNAEAQQFFDQGLRLIYAFNHDEAARSFQKASELDPKLAMAYWGIAEAVGPNYNDPASEDRFKQAHGAIQKAVAPVTANALTSQPWQSVFRPIPRRICAKQRRIITMPCARW
jgi:hypothetical protein